SEKEKKQLEEKSSPVSFADLLLHAFREYGVILLGGFTGEKGSIKPLINPMGADHEKKDGGGGFSTAVLTGLIGMTREGASWTG
ncbi:MAG: hypothetical protein ABIJ56_03530, partial [Pseudomonadota bacterium]